MVVTLLDISHSFLKPSSVSSVIRQVMTETTADFVYIVHTNEAQEGMRRAICVGDVDMLSIACQWFYCQAIAS
jgi:hypothetical protein